MKRSLGILAACLLMGSWAMAADFSWPMTGRITATRYYSSGRYHGAIDLAGAYGRAIGAARAGYARQYYTYGGYGRYVIVTHSAGYRTIYGHMSRYGYRGSVGRNTTIGYEGSTGNSTGPHLHFELQRYGTRQYIPGYVGQYKYRGYPVYYNYSGIY
jgi:murein DD-endopeptidase MepM/ murein hydrolase activator NlpD